MNPERKMARYARPLALQFRDAEIRDAADFVWKLWAGQRNAKTVMKRGIMAGMVEGAVEALEAKGIELVFSEAGVTWRMIPKGERSTDEPSSRDALEREGADEEPSEEVAGPNRGTLRPD